MNKKMWARMKNKENKKTFGDETRNKQNWVHYPINWTEGAKPLKDYRVNSPGVWGRSPQ